MSKLQALYQKVEDFSQSYSAELQTLSHCQKGCSRCCYTDLSVFEIEAQNIQNYLQSLSSEVLSVLKDKLKTPLNETDNFFGEKAKACVFLKDEACTIYEARPLICRTQGLALKFKLEGECFLDICPLNDEMLDHIQDKELLNLDLLNLILSQLENEASGNTQRPRVKLADLIKPLVE